MDIRTLTRTSATASQVDAGIAVLRIVLGVVMVAHGWQKLFQFGIAGVTAGFDGMGIPMAGLVAPAVSVLEFGGGILLIPGLFSRPVALLVALNMVGAMLMVHMPAGFFMPNGMEFTLILAAAALAVLFIGPGRYSVDGRISSPALDAGR